MKASDIYELVREWPKAVWPRDWSYNPLFRPSGRLFACGVHISDDHAALLFEASGMRWLAERLHYCDGDVKISMPDRDAGPEVGVWAVDAGDENWKHGPTLLHALSAAILAVAHNPETPGAAK